MAGSTHDRKKRGCLTSLLVIFALVNIGNLVGWALFKYRHPEIAARIEQEEATEKQREQINEIAQKLIFDPEFAFYYSQLDADGQKLYRQVFAAVDTINSELELTGLIPFDRVDLICRSVYYDQPQLFWWDYDLNIIHQQQGETLTTLISFKYNELATGREFRQHIFESTALEIINGAKEYDTIYEQELFVHDTLAVNTFYDLESANNQSAYSALVNHRSVCAGQARAFQYVMQQLGVPTYYVTGRAVDPDDENGNWQAHAWNLVKIDGEYYNVDVTWDKMNAHTFPDQNEQVPTYRYFNRTDQFFTAHKHQREAVTTNAEQQLPPAKSTEYSFEALFGNPQLTKILGPAFGTTEDDFITDLEQYFAVTLDKLTSSVSTITDYYLIIHGTALMNSISNLTDKRRNNGYLNALFQNKYRNYHSYSIKMKSIELGDGTYLLYVNHSFK